MTTILTLGSPLAGTQIRRVGFGVPTADTTDEKIAKDYHAELKAFSDITGRNLGRR